MKLYFSSYENEEFAEPRTIIEFDKNVIGHTNFLIAKVDKPLIGHEYGWSGKDITEFYITNRFPSDDDLLARLDKFPIHINILIRKNPEKSPSFFTDLFKIAPACLYDNIESAEKHNLLW